MTAIDQGDEAWPCQPTEHGWPWAQKHQLGTKAHALKQRLLDLIVAGQLSGIDDGIAGNVRAQPSPQRPHALCGDDAAVGGY